MAPEVISGSQYDDPVDIWSFGITVLECAQSVPPLFSMGPTVATTRIAARGVLPLSDILVDESVWSSDFRSFVELCLAYRPSDRPTSGQLLGHRFFDQCQSVTPATVFASVKQ
jgi:serine/threonine kinase 4